MNKIIVGTDGSEPSLLAVDWAAGEAARRGASLHVVYVVTPWLFDVPDDPGAAQVRERMLHDGRGIVDVGAARAAERAPGLRVTGEQAGGQPAKVLIERARDAIMLVTGARGRGGLAGLVLGSTAMQVTAHAPGPAVVVRAHEPSEHGEIVLGVDGSPAGAGAIGFAFEEASVRGARLRALLAWTHPVSTGPGDMLPLVYDREILAGDARRLLAESLAGWRSKYPEVEVVAEAVRGRPGSVLTEASARADLLVVGSRGHGGFAGLLLGSVGQAMLHRAHSPVAIVHGSP
ncbi:universal stress protein [Actinomadura monticuli]|uniref:Universal stress protein n=1 Tax=Actinomadura monticuli TaxID=3097367 RepID=A0ABV4QF30_9ACTN